MQKKNKNYRKTRKSVKDILAPRAKLIRKIYVLATTETLTISESVIINIYIGWVTIFYNNELHFLNEIKTCYLLLKTHK